MIETLASILEKKGPGVYSVAPDAAVHDALSIMAEKNVAAVLVLVDGTLVGIVSTRDYGNKVVLRGRSARDTRVREIMTSPVITVSLDASALECMAIMTRNHIRHLPVVRKGDLVGVVSMGDLASAVVADQAFKIEQLMTYVGHT